MNWLLRRGYQVLCKDYSSARTRRLAESVEIWVDDSAGARASDGLGEQAGH